MKKYAQSGYIKKEGEDQICYIQLMAFQISLSIQEFISSIHKKISQWTQ